MNEAHDERRVRRVFQRVTVHWGREKASLLLKCKLLIQTQGIIRVLRCLLIVCCRNFDVYEAAKDHLHFHSLIAKGRTSVCSRN